MNIFRPEELPPRSPVQVVQEAGCGLGVGLLIGYVFKSVGQIAISTVGGGLVSLSGKYPAYLPLFILSGTEIKSVFKFYNNWDM